MARTLANAGGLQLVGGCVSAWLSGQILIGGAFFLTILPDGSATDGSKVIPARTVLLWAALGVALALGSVAAFLAYGRARRGDARRAFAYGLAASLLPPTNPIILAGTILAWRASHRRAAAQQSAQETAQVWAPSQAPLAPPMQPAPPSSSVAPTDASPISTRPPLSGLLRAGGWVTLAGAALWAAAAVASVVELAGMLLDGPVVPRGVDPALAFPAVAMGVLTIGGFGALFAAGAVLGVLAWRNAMRGRARPAAGWGFAAAFLPPLNPVLALGAVLCIASPESQAAAPVAPAAQPP